MDWTSHVKNVSWLKVHGNFQRNSETLPSLRLFNNLICSLICSRSPSLTPPSGRKTEPGVRTHMQMKRVGCSDACVRAVDSADDGCGDKLVTMVA